MKIKVLPQEFTVCKIQDITQFDFTDTHFFIGKTEEELSLVCSSARCPQNCLEKEDGWRGFYIEGVLDFSLVGVLAKLTQALANQNISVFAISTFHTDYLLVKQNQFIRAMQTLKQQGYTIAETE